MPVFKSLFSYPEIVVKIKDTELGETKYAELSLDEAKKID